MKLGIIGGSGLYELYDAEEKHGVSSIDIETPFGTPSGSFTKGFIDGVEVVFLPRHGQGHTILPCEVNHKANIFAMKKLGITHLLSLSAVGSLREEMRPRDIVIVDQYFDRTKSGGSDHSFFGNGIVAHIAFGDPVCPILTKCAFDATCAALEDTSFEGSVPRVHNGGTYVNMEGPAFSTRAESNTYRSWGFDVIGMTNLPEAKLCREAEISYATVAMVTDYDCWHQAHDNVTVEMIIGNLNANATLAKNIVKKVAAMHQRLEDIESPFADALASAIITRPEAIPDSVKRDLQPIIGKYIKL